MASPASGAWPPLPYEDWKPTKETLHRYTQMVGKLRMSLMPFRNHWWHVTLYVSARGLSTGPMPYGDVTVEVEFDFVDHRLHVRTSEGRLASVGLRDGLSCAGFYSDLFATLREVGVQASIRPQPFDLGDSPRSPMTIRTTATTPTPSSAGGASCDSPIRSSARSRRASTARRAPRTSSGTPSISPTPATRDGAPRRSRAPTR